MQPFRQDLLSSLGASRPSGDARLSALVSRDATEALRPVESAAELLMPSAIAPTEDSAELSTLGGSLADLQALIEQLNSAASSGEVGDTLRAVKDLVSNTTGASYVGSALADLADLADTVLNALESDPTALDGGFALSFNASFSQEATIAQDYEQQYTSFSFSFSLETADTTLTASGSYEESYVRDGNTLQYESYEDVSLSLVTLNANLATNPVLDAFNRLAEKLTGFDPASLLAPVEEPVTQEPVVDVAAPYQLISPMEKLQTYLSQLLRTSDSTQSLLEELVTLREEKQTAIAA